MDFIVKNELGIASIDNEKLKFSYEDEIKNLLLNICQEARFSLYIINKSDIRNIHDEYGGNAISTFYNDCINKILELNEAKEIWRLDTNIFCCKRYNKREIVDIQVNYLEYSAIILEKVITLTQR